MSRQPRKSESHSDEKPDQSTQEDQVTEKGFMAVGDVMLECILPHQVFPERNQTRVVEFEKIQIGGPPLNIVWHLLNLGYRARLVAFVGSRDRSILERQFPEINWDNHSILSCNEWTDLLIEYRDSIRGFRAMYVGVRPGVEVIQKLREMIETTRLLIINGSRHKIMRSTYIDIAKSVKAASRNSVIAFNPSYALYEYERTEFRSLLDVVDITILNRQETKQALEFCGETQIHKLVSRPGQILITTREHEGADVWMGTKDKAQHFESLSGITGDFLGAGDGFFAGFLAEFERTGDLLKAGSYAAKLAAAIVKSGAIRPQINESDLR